MLPHRPISFTVVVPDMCVKLALQRISLYFFKNTDKPTSIWASFKNVRKCCFSRVSIVPGCIFSVIICLGQLEALTKPFLWPPLLSFLTRCTGLHCTMVLVPNPDPSHRIRTSYVNLQKQSDTTNKLPFPSLRRQKGITLQIIPFFWQLCILHNFT